MPIRLSEFTQSLRQLGEIQVNDWDVRGLMNNEIDLADSLRKLGNLKVSDLEFGAVMPTFHKLAYHEVEMPEVVQRAARFKVLDWDFRTAENPTTKKPPKDTRMNPDHGKVQDLKDRLRGFLQFSVVNLISEPDRAEIRIQDLQPGVVRFRLLVSQKDVKELIGRNGATASAIRNLLKAAAESHGMLALLEILSHEEELALSARQG